MLDTRYAVLFLTPRYLAKLHAGGWIEKEAGGLLGNVLKVGRVIPLWHDIKHPELEAVSPLLAGLVGLQTNGRAAALAPALFELIRGPHAAGGVRKRRCGHSNWVQGATLAESARKGA